MKPFQYQKECVYEVEAFNGRALLALDPGLGKTAIALWYLKRNPEALPAVVVCPASVKWHWDREAKKILKLQAHVLEGRRTGEQLSAQVIILNYDILAYWLKKLKQLRPRTIFLDEVQYTANQTKRTNASRSLCKGRPYVLGLSGTPLVNRPIELWNGLQMIRPDKFRHRWGYIKEFCGLKKTFWGWDYRGASNTQKLNQLLLDSCMIRRRMVDVLPDLPEKIRQVIPVEISDPEQYRQAEDDFLGWLRKQDRFKADRAARAEAMTKVGYLLRLAAELKLPSVFEWIDDFLTGNNKLIVFAKHRRIIAALQAHAKKGFVTVDGSITGKNRQRAVEDFQGNPKTRLLIGQLEAAGVGMDGLQKASNTALFTEFDWSPGRMLQCEGRPHRIGATGIVWCVYLVARDTIEEKLCSIIQRKQKVLTDVLDGEAEGEELDMFDQLMKHYHNQGRSK